jgi:hypothetical protein
MLTLSAILCNYPDIEEFSMSDGPHRSLPMSSGWKRVAERGDKHAFASEEISRALIPALAKDCQEEMQLGFIDHIHKAFHEYSLFSDGLAQQLESLRGIAGVGIGRTILDHAIMTADRGVTGQRGLEQAVESALQDRAAKGARQVEEHYCREASTPRAQKVRERIEEGIRGADLGGLARQILKIDAPATRPSLRREGLDDGVML